MRIKSLYAVGMWWNVGELDPIENFGVVTDIEVEIDNPANIRIWTNEGKYIEIQARDVIVVKEKER
jgi:hypothetical protein